MKTSNINRREFLTHSLTLATAAATGCVSLDKSPGGIIDTHTHFYDPTRPEGVDWPGKDDTVLYRKVMPEEFKRIAVPTGITGTVVVEASPRVADNQWVLDLAAREPFLIGIVGHLKPGRPGFADDLARFASNKRFKGIRIGGWDVPVDSAREQFVADLRKLSERNLSLDVLGGPETLDRVERVARAIPELRIVINHCAGVRIDGGKPPELWAEGIRGCAAHRNVFIKGSAMVEQTGRKASEIPSDVAFYKPVLDTIWEAFGDERVIFGSNWPVSSRFAELSQVVRLAKDYAASRGRKASALYLSQNARRAYRLSPA
ncbi:MAG: amidohydrolase [Pedosphaera sp.]|nr:amidohydrolase [Pedosphaera sp.]